MVWLRVAFRWRDRLLVSADEQRVLVRGVVAVTEQRDFTRALEQGALCGCVGNQRRLLVQKLGVVLLLERGSQF